MSRICIPSPCFYVFQLCFYLLSLPYLHLIQTESQQPLAVNKSQIEAKIGALASLEWFLITMWWQK